MIDDVGERSSGSADFVYFVLGVLSVCAAIERFEVTISACDRKRAPASTVGGPQDAHVSAARTRHEDPCLLAALGALGFARRVSDLQAGLTAEGGSGAPPVPREPALPGRLESLLR